MITQSLIATFYITWGTILLLNYLPQLNASEIPTSSIIIQATKQKHQLLSRQLRSFSSNGSFKSTNQPLNPTQHQQCVTDLSLADANGDAQLDKSEFISFLSLNSAYYGYEWGYASNQVSFSELPLEFPMLFHSTACMCAYEQQPGVDFGCCEGDNGHILVYGEEDGGMTPEQEAYTRLFCTEAFYSYKVTFSPTKSPTFRPSDTPTMSPSTPQPTDSMMPTISQAPTEPRPTESPVVVTMEPTTMAPTAKPNVKVPIEPTAPPTAFVTPSPAPMIAAPVKLPTTSPTKKASTSDPTTSPVKGATSSPTSSPVAALTKRPTASPNAQPITSRPTTSSPIRTPGPPTSSPVSSATGTPTRFPSPTATISPTISGGILEIEISYGISSNCNMTADDVLNGNYGITIKEGLVSATEAVVIDTLNTTYPRDGTNDARTRTVNVNEDAPKVMMDNSANSASKAMMYAPGVGVRVRVEVLPVKEDDHAMMEHANSASGASGSSSHQKENPKAVYAPGVGVRVRVEGLPHGPGATRRHLAILPGKGELHKRLNNHAQGHHHQYHQLQRHQLQQQQTTTNQQRSLVYYTLDNPIIITDAQDVACQPEINCMRISSTVYLQLEQGDDADEIESVVFNGIQATIQEGSFFQGIPQDTIFCPPSTIKPTSSPTVTKPTSASPTTISPVAVPTTTSPTTTPPTSAPPSNVPTLSPVGVVEEPTSVAPTDYRWPTYYPTSSLAPTTQFPSALPSEATSEGPMEVTITYDLSNDCGLTAEAIMNEEDNTLKEGLVAATTTITIGILNQTFPRVEDEEPTRRNVRARHVQRGLAHLDTTPTATAKYNNSNTNTNGGQKNRNLVYYTDEYPVTINRILDVETGCATGQNCLLVISAITVVLEPGDDPAAVNAAIVKGMKASFIDGSFFGAIPADTVICPT